MLLSETGLGLFKGLGLKMADLGAGAALQAQPTRLQLGLHAFGQLTKEKKEETGV